MSHTFCPPLAYVSSTQCPSLCSVSDTLCPFFPVSYSQCLPLNSDVVLHSACVRDTLSFLGSSVTFTVLSLVPNICSQCPLLCPLSVTRSPHLGSVVRYMASSLDPPHFTSVSVWWQSVFQLVVVWFCPSCFYMHARMRCRGGLRWPRTRHYLVPLRATNRLRMHVVQCSDSFVFCFNIVDEYPFTYCRHSVIDCDSLCV